MSEELQEYFRLVKNDPNQRDNQMIEYIDSMVNIHEKQFNNLINPKYNLSLLTILLSYVERLSYLDKNRANYETYSVFADLLEVKKIKQSQYEENMKKCYLQENKPITSIANMVVELSKDILNPIFRVNLILFSIGIFKDEGEITSKQKQFIAELFKKLQI